MDNVANKEFDLYKDIQMRTGGEIYIGVIGPVRTGKSTLIREALGSHLKECGGFTSQRLIDGSGQTKGFRIGPAATTPLTAPLAAMLPKSDLSSAESFCDAPVLPDKAGGVPSSVLPHVLTAPNGTVYGNVFKYFADDGRVHKDQSVFDKAGVDLLNSSKGWPMVLLDEIGGSELLCEPFCQALDEVLASGTPCLGVLKLAESARHMQRAYGFDSQNRPDAPGKNTTRASIVDRNLQLRQRILEEYGGQILYFDRNGPQSEAEAVRETLTRFVTEVFR